MFECFICGEPLTSEDFKETGVITIDEDAYMHKRCESAFRAGLMFTMHKRCEKYTKENRKESIKK